MIAVDDVVASYSSRGPVGNPEDAVDVGTEAGSGGAGQRDRGGRRAGHRICGTTTRSVACTGASGGTYLTLSGSSMAAGVVTRRGGAGAAGEAEADAGAGEVRAAVHGGTAGRIRVDRAGRGQPGRAAGGVRWRRARTCASAPLQNDDRRRGRSRLARSRSRTRSFGAARSCGAARALRATRSFGAVERAGNTIVWGSQP